MKIFKYRVPINKMFPIDLPEDSIILDFQSQDNELFIWCMIDEDNKIEKRLFSVYTTGEEIEPPINYGYRYIGTAQDKGFSMVFVWHLFEIKEV